MKKTILIIALVALAAPLAAADHPIAASELVDEFCKKWGELGTPPPPPGILFELTDVATPPDDTLDPVRVELSEAAPTLEAFAVDVRLTVDSWETSTCIVYATGPRGYAGDVVYAQVRKNGRKLCLLSGEGSWRAGAPDAKPRACRRLDEPLKAGVPHVFELRRSSAGVTLSVHGEGLPVQSVELGPEAALAPFVFGGGVVNFGHPDNRDQRDAGELPTVGTIHRAAVRSWR